MSDKLRIEYQEVSADEVMRYFVAGFKPTSGEITGHEWFYDPHKGKVIFKLFITTEGTSTDRTQEG